MSGTWSRWLAIALVGALVGTTDAEPIVSTGEPTSQFRGMGYSGKWADGHRDAYEHRQSTYYLERRGVVNRLAWEFIERTESRAVLEIESEIFSYFEPEHDFYSCDRSGVCSWGHSDDRYDETTLTAQIPIVAPQPMSVTVTVHAEAIEGTPFFRMGYFNRTVSYAADPAAGELAPTTTMIPNLLTDNPLDVYSFIDRFSIAPGSHFIGLEMLSSYAERGLLFDASMQVTVVFAAVPEPTAAALLALGCSAVLIQRRS